MKRLCSLRAGGRPEGGGVSDHSRTCSTVCGYGETFPRGPIVHDDEYGNNCAL
jgi:hypothetical protein